MPQRPVTQRGTVRIPIRSPLDLQLRLTVAEHRPPGSGDAELAAVIESQEAIAVGTCESGSGTSLEQESECRAGTFALRNALQQGIRDIAQAVETKYPPIWHNTIS
jgi:hypothetical protein